MATGTLVNNNQILIFFDNQTSNANSVPQNCSFSKGVLKIWGTWDGATITLSTGTPLGNTASIEVSDFSLNPITFSSTTECTLESIVWNDPLFASLSNAGGSTNISMTLQRL
jgi:hypothetical protein